ncbi:MAG: thiamine phosphate synthase [Sulfuricellaceae bacterium]|nr:thiamine phosphate synthase [Sulfuricellaceae bacterium]
MFEGLYAITPDTADTPVLLEQVRQALEGGAQAVQYRNKSGDAALRHEQGSELLALCREFSIPLIVNDDVRLADLIGADGVHLGQDDSRLSAARVILGPDKIIGISCYADLGRALAAEREGADYVAFGRFFPSQTKPDAPPAPLSLLREAKQRLRIPIVAIGGIDLDNAARLVAAGADAVAVVSALFGADDIRLTAECFAARFQTSH